MMSMNLKNIAILNIKIIDYHCNITEIRRNEAISVIQNTDLNEKRGTLQNTKKFIFIYKNEQRIFNVWQYDGQTNLMYFLIEDDDLVKKYNTIWNKVSADIKKSLIASLPTIKTF